LFPPNRDKLEEEKEFEVVGDLSELQPKEEEQKSAEKASNGGSHNGGSGPSNKGGRKWHIK
jgi:hypothetical protein